MCNQHRELADLEMSIQSTLTLWTTRYYGHPVSTDMGWSPGELDLLKTTPAIMDSLYHGHQILVPMVSVITRVDCTWGKRG